MRARLTTVIWAAAVAVVGPACAAGDSPLGTSGITSVALADHLELEIGEARQISADVVAENGAGTGVTWRSSNPSVAAVVSRAGGGQTAEVTAVSLGSTIVRATSTTDTSKFAEAQVIVGPANVAIVTLTPAAPEVIKGQTIALTVTAKTPHGVTVSGRSVTWATSNPTVATISDQGTLAGVGYGTATITATVDGIFGTAIATVKSGPVAQLVIGPPNPQITRGGTVRLTLDVRDAFGNEIDLAGTNPAWTSSAASVATVNTDGVVTGISPGLATITASVDGKSAAVGVTVQDAPPATIAVAPGLRSVEEGKAVRLSAVIKDASGSVLALNAAWRSLDAQIATVSSDGLVTGVATSPAQARIVASVAASGTQTLADTVLITVTPASVATIQVGVAATSIEVGEQTPATATLRGEGGQVLTGRTVTWSSSAPNVASVSATGVVTGVGPGSATITAQREGKSGAASVQVVAAAPDRLDLSPATASVVLGRTQILTATVRDRRGGLISGCPISWSTSNPAVATVSAGLVTGVSVGSASITAQCLTKQATATVQVSPGSTVTIVGIYRAGTTTPADLTNLSGDVDVAVAYASDAATPKSVDLMVDGIVVSAINLPLDGLASERRLALSTGEVNLATGAVRFRNGSRRLDARLKLQDETLVIASVTVVLNNADGFIATLTPIGSGTISNFEWWYGGPTGGTTALVTPVIYSQGKSIASVRVKIGSGPVMTRASAPFTIPFTATSYAGYTAHSDPEPLVITESIYSDGSSGPTKFIDGFTVPTVRLDFVAPTPPKTDVMPTFVNRAYNFFTTNIKDGTDSGIGLLSTLVGVTTGTLPPAGSACFDGLTVVVFGSQLDETASQNVYRGRATSIDRLGNRSCADLQPGGINGGQFGADFTPPTMSVSRGPTDSLMSATSTPDFLVSALDNTSGFGTTPVRVSITKSSAGNTTCVVGVAPNCAPFDEPYGFPSSDGSNGFYTATIRVSDQAGNLSTPVTRSYLIDNVAPAVDWLSIPSPLSYRDANSTVFKIAAADNISLGKAYATLSYGSRVFSQNIGPLGGLFGPPLVPAINFSFGWSGMVRCIDNVKPSALGVTVSDQIGLTGSATLPLASAQVEDCAPFEFPVGGTLKLIGANPSTVSRSGGVTLLSLAVEAPPSATAPFSWVFIYQSDGATYRLVGFASGAPVQNGNTQTWTYTSAYRPSSDTPIGQVPLLVLMVDNNGDAASAVLTVTVTQ